MKNQLPRRLLRWLVRGGLISAFLVVALFAGSNLFLVSKPGQRFLQKNLNRRTPGLSWQISGATWSPWNGITVQKLSATINPPSGSDSPELLPLLTLQETELKPYWGQLLRGKKLFREITLDQPEFNIPIEYFVIAKPTKPTPPPAPPQPKSKPKPKPKNDSPKPPKKSKPKAKSKPKSQSKPKQKQKPQPKVETLPPDEKRFWIHLRQAKVRLYSLKFKTSLDFRSLNADLPLAGPETKGKLSWQQVTLVGQPLLEATTLPIEWKHPHWTLPNQSLTLNLPRLAPQQSAPPSLQIQVGGIFAPRIKTRDFRFHTSLPPQPFPDYLVHQSSRSHFKAQSTAANLTARGRLLHPNSWQVDSSLALDNIEVYSELRGQHFHFDTARTNLQLQQSTILLPTLSLRSERLSLMGNGQLHLGGYLLAVTRIVADPEFNERLTNIAVGSFINRGWTQHWLSPLDTPDRYYRDLHFEGFLPNAAVNTGNRESFIPLPEVIRLLRNFTSNEVAEESQTPS